MPERKIVAYRLRRPGLPGWMFAGTRYELVADCLRRELEMHYGLPADECGQIVVEAYETTEEEIENLPEFGGW